MTPDVVERVAELTRAGVLRILQVLSNGPKAREELRKLSQQNGRDFLLTVERLDELGIIVLPSHRRDPVTLTDKGYDVIAEFVTLYALTKTTK